MLGKLGQDVAHGCQAEVRELRLAGGGARCRRARMLLLADLVPEVAVIGVLVVTTAAISGLA